MLQTSHGQSDPAAGRPSRSFFGWRTGQSRLSDQSQHNRSAVEQYTEPLVASDPNQYHEVDLEEAKVNTHNSSSAAAHVVPTGPVNTGADSSMLDTSSSHNNMSEYTVNTTLNTTQPVNSLL